MTADEIYADVLDKHHDLFDDVREIFDNYNSGQAEEATNWLIDQLVVYYVFNDETREELFDLFLSDMYDLD